MTTYYTKEHEWIRVEGDNATVGITDFAQGQLGDIVFVEVPAAGTQVKKGGDAAVVESVKAASDIYAPVSGERSEEHTSELKSLMRISYAVFCLKKKKDNHNHQQTTLHTSL